VPAPLSRLKSALDRLTPFKTPHGPWRIDLLTLPVEDFEFVALVEERSEIASRAKQLEELLMALADASPDLSIAMWERFRDWARSNSRHALLSASGISGEAKGSEMPSELARVADPMAFGCWRARMALLALHRLAQAVEAVPSEMMIRTAKLARGHETLLRHAIEKQARDLVESWATKTGDRFEVDLIHVRHGRTGVTLEVSIRRPV
jgi:hypothetical protein